MMVRAKRQALKPSTAAGIAKRLIVATLFVGSVAAIAPGTIASTGKSTAEPTKPDPCPRANGDPADELDALRDDITLAPAEGSAQRVVNIDADRDPEIVRGIRIEADAPVPDEVTEKTLEIYGDPLVRTGDETLETVAFADLEFSEPRYLSNRRRIEFAVCLDPSGVPAGQYQTLVTIGGPEGLKPATIAITANTKEGWPWFWGGVLLALGAALATLVLTGISEKRAELKPPGSSEWPSWRAGFKEMAEDPVWWFSSGVALAAAFGAVVTTYLADPSWGASPLTGVFGLIVAAFAAVGGQALLAGLRQGTR